MFKNVLISLLVAGISIVSMPTFAEGIGSQDVNVSAISIAKGAEINVALTEMADKSSDKANNATSQAQFKPTESSQSTLPSGWLFAVALFWFVVLSNRRGV